MYTWNKNWICIYESPWGIINKFLYANEIHGISAAKELTTGRKRVLNSYRGNFIHTGIISNYQMLENSWFTDDISIEEYGTNLLNRLLKPFIIHQNVSLSLNSICRLLIRKDLYYCPECMKNGNHLVIHQFTFFKECPIHNIALRNTCPICGNKIPYAIEFSDNVRCFSCKYCGERLFHDDNFGEAITYWLHNSNKYFMFEDFKLKEIPIIISNRPNQNLTESEINNVLYCIYCKIPNKINAKYIITKRMEWNDIDLGDIITPNLCSVRKIEEYVYIYAFQRLYRHICRSKHLRKKIYKAEEYIRNCCTYHEILSTMQIDNIYKLFDLDAVTLYLWKRDMEYSASNKYPYYMNKQNSYNYIFDPNYEIMNYIKKIRDILPDSIHDGYKFSILVHIALTLMNDKYKKWVNMMYSLYQENDKYKLTKKLDNIEMRESSDCFNKEFLLTINHKENIYKLYFS